MGLDRGRMESRAKQADGHREQSGRNASESRYTVASASANRLLHLQQSAGNQAVLQLLAVEHSVPAKEKHAPALPPLDAVSRSGGGKGLPDSLKTGIERLSGIDMNDIRVHYNSGRPEQLHALAYAQGNEIHLGPGQERHLPHEAWHAVQQRQGRVQPTMQFKDQKLNDDEGLEREADEMGERALQLGATGHGDADATHYSGDFKSRLVDSSIQRRVKPYDTSFADPSIVTKYEGKMEQLVETINQRVLKARSDAIAWQTFAAETTNKHLMNWHQSAKSFVDNPVEEPKMIHARFGYAIETLACEGLAGTHDGLRIDLQVSSGHTRPDIVISADRMELAWIDITSERSESHIIAKDGAGWRRRPFVYEVLYNPLDLKELLASTNDNFYNEYGQFVADEHQIEYEVTEQVKTGMRNELVALRDTNEWETGYGNKAKKKEKTRDFLFRMTGSEDLYVEDHRNNMQHTKGALHYLGLNSGPFGFSGSDKETNSVSKEYVRRVAEPRIEEEKDRFATGKNLELANSLAQYYEMFPAVQQFCDTANAFTPSRELAKTGMALKAAITDYFGMDMLFLHIKSFFPDDSRSNKLLAYAKEVRERFPAEADFDQIMSWRNEVKQLYSNVGLLQKIMPVQQQFIEYVGKKYTFFNRPQEINNMLHEFAKDVPSESVIEAARNWMATHPLI